MIPGINYITVARSHERYTKSFVTSVATRFSTADDYFY